MGAVVIIGSEPLARSPLEEIKTAGFEERIKRAECVIYIPARGNGRSMSALQELLERAEKAKELEKEAQSFQISPIPKDLPNILSALEDVAEEDPAAGVDKRIRVLKKELKHTKNPMERKRINQELCTTYTEKKHPEKKWMENGRA